MRQLGLAPSEFWQMPPRHFWWLVRAEEKKGGPKNMPQSDYNELLDLLEQAERGEI